MGPRQSGKTTLAKMMFPNYTYYNLEDIRLRERIEQDPKGFINKQEGGVILDEVQKYSEILSYIQINIDENFKPAKFVLTGSENLLLSEKISQSLAGRIEQILNLSSIANDVGVTYKTIESWISILESTYIAYTLQPYYENFGKRVIKSPKIYFYDTGLVCYLLGIDSVKELNTHPLIGNIFENFIISDIKKELFNKKSSSKIYFWRDSKKNEIDLLIKNGNSFYPIEIKAGFSFSSDYLKGIKIWTSLKKETNQSHVIYNGDNDKILDTKMTNWKSIANITGLL